MSRRHEADGSDDVEREVGWRTGLEMGVGTLGVRCQLAGRGLGLPLASTSCTTQRTRRCRPPCTSRHQGDRREQRATRQAKGACERSPRVHAAAPPEVDRKGTGRSPGGALRGTVPLIGSGMLGPTSRSRTRPPLRQHDMRYATDAALAVARRVAGPDVTTPPSRPLGATYSDKAHGTPFILRRAMYRSSSYGSPVRNMAVRILRRERAIRR